MKPTLSRTLCYAGRQDCSDMHSYGPGVRTCWVIHYVIKGCGFFVRGGRTHKISAGQSFVIRPYEKIRYYPDGDNPWEYTWIEFSDESYMLPFGKIKYCSGNCVVDYIEPEKILPLFDYLCTVFKRPDRAHFQNTARSAGLCVLSVYADCHPKAEETNGSYAYFNAACLLIQSSFRRPLFDIDTICTELHISRTTLYRSFIKNCGISPGAYLGNYRMERAKELLERGVSVKVTALSCGFSDPLYFSKAFRRENGCPPGEYRKKHTVSAPPDANSHPD